MEVGPLRAEPAQGRRAGVTLWALLDTVITVSTGRPASRCVTWSSASSATAARYHRRMSRPVLYKVREYAEALGTHESTVYRMIAAGELRALQRGPRHCVRILPSPDELELLSAAHRSASQSASTPARPAHNSRRG